MATPSVLDPHKGQATAPVFGPKGHSCVLAPRPTHRPTHTCTPWLIKPQPHPSLLDKSTANLHCLTPPTASTHDPQGQSHTLTTWPHTHTHTHQHTPAHPSTRPKQRPTPMKKDTMPSRLDPHKKATPQPPPPYPHKGQLHPMANHSSLLHQ